MEKLIEFKLRLQKHQEINRDMVEWAMENSTVRCIEKWRATEQECDFVIFLIDDFISKNQTR